MKGETLKDLPKLDLGSKEGKVDVVSVEKLRQEAIKWAKEWGYTKNHNFCKFFNITEEELTGEGKWKKNLKL